MVLGQEKWAAPPWLLRSVEVPDGLVLVEDHGKLDMLLVVVSNLLDLGQQAVRHVDYVLSSSREREFAAAGLGS